MARSDQSARNMEMKRVYLDDAGSAPVLPQVRDALRVLPDGNPSSPHTEGRAARATLDLARDQAGAALGAHRTEVTFLSSGTEAVNLALLGAARRPSNEALIVTWTAEHQSVLAAIRHLHAEGHAVKIANVDTPTLPHPSPIPPAPRLASIAPAT